MNLRYSALSALALNLCLVPTVFAEKGHHHYPDHHFLAEASPRKLIEIIYNKCDEIDDLKKENTNLKKGLIPHKREIIMWSMAAGSALTISVVAVIKAYWRP